MRKATQATQDAVQVARDTLSASQQAAIQQNADNVRTASDAKDTSNKSFQATIDNFHREQRAWIAGILVTGNPVIGQQWKIRVGSVNTGRTPGRQVHIVVHGEPVQGAAKPHFQVLKTDRSSSVVGPTNGVHLLVDASLVPLTQDDVALIRSKAFIYVVFGRIDYSDVFNVNHWTTFCVYWRPEQEDFSACLEGNDVDSNIK